MLYPTGFTPRWSDCYAVRISYPYNQIPGHFWEWLGHNLCEAVYATAHNDTDTPHVHIALYNARVARDNVRKYIIRAVKDCIEDNPPTGNALMSTKKWDGNDTYLMYLTKGNRHSVIANSWYKRTITPDGMRIREFEIIGDRAQQELRDEWKEDESKASEQFSAWKKSDFYPHPKIITRTHSEMLASTDGGWLTKTEPIPFDTIKWKAIEYAMEYCKVKRIDNAVRFVAKNLISNYHFEYRINIPPYYI